MIKLSLVFLISFFSLSFNNPSLAIATTKPNNSSPTFIKKCCNATPYSALCYATLSGFAAQIQNSPVRLATKSLSVALIEAQSTAKTMARLSRVHGLRPNVRTALSDCSMAVTGCAAQLQRSIQEMGHSPTHAEMEASDIQTWTSTALTYAGTCRDVFDGSDMNGNVKVIVQKKVFKLYKLTSNALALVKRYYISSAWKARHNNKTTHP